ncbi:hypothetical protein NEMIN01_2286 [Nematocida minor]|uniref:uncharacterized protein n=1 Tax=Nematocida minor TaxID=1912983 RepID=UPI00221F8958|nr:uncharacterized protein NEMIN01_2286 [Nematocida minor]KAI5192916.1 hypothetical protein NEMIN01_2286 [Nematocida minor]
MKEVKLKIKLKELLKACESIKLAGKLLKYHTPKDYIDIVDCIFKDVIEIESGANREEEKAIQDILKNRVREYFTYVLYGKNDMKDLYRALRDEEQEELRKAFIHIANQLIRPNKLIYNPKDGIHRQVDENEPMEDIDSDDASSDLSPRTCTLEVDYADFVSLESMQHLAEESMNREFFYNAANLFYSKKNDMNILKAYLPEEEERFTLDNLYTIYNNGVALVDDGLNLVYSKFYEIEELVKKIKIMEARSSDESEIVREIRMVLRLEELRIAISVIENIEQIMYEKAMQKGMIDAIEYIASSTPLLKEKDGSNTLKIDDDLSGFEADYITRKKGLKNIVNKRADELNEKIISRTQDLNREKAKLDQAKTEGKNKEEIDELERLVNELDHEIYSLNCENKKVYLQILNIISNLRHHSCISPFQKGYIIREIGQTMEKRKVKVVLKPLLNRKITEKEKFRIYSAVIRLKDPVITTKQKVILAMAFVVFLVAASLLSIYLWNTLKTISVI